MADPYGNDFTMGLLVGLLLAGGSEEDGPYEEELEYFLRDRLGSNFRGLPFPPHHLFRRRRRRLEDAEQRLSRLEDQLRELAPAMGSFAWALSTGARPDDMDQLVALPVRVYLETAGHYPQALVSAAEDLIKEMGFEVIAMGWPQVGSFRQRFVGLIKGFFSRKQTQDTLEKAGRALELHLLDQPQADATKTLAEATAKLLEQVNSQKGAVCLQVGSLLIVRYKPEGKKEFVTVARTLSAMQLRRLEENQAQLDEPNKILSWLGISSQGTMPPALPSQSE